MASLVLHAPYSRFKGTGETFEEMVRSGIARGYILLDKEYAQLSLGCAVILLDKERENRAEGELVKLTRSDKAGNGQQRYDVRFKNARLVPYKSERLNRSSGTAVID